MSCEVNSAIGELDGRLNQLFAGDNHQVIINTIRQVVLEDVEKKVLQKSTEMWERGKQTMKKMQDDHREKSSKLTGEVTQCTERMQILEAENESLKQAILGLESRFLMFGAALSTVKGGGAPNEEIALAKSPGQHEDTLDSDTQTDTKMPEIPPFPFPVPFSLEVSLGSQMPQRMPLSLVDTLAPPVSPMTLAPPAAQEAPWPTFSFTLRKAEGIDLGLDMSQRHGHCGLYVEGVLPGGAVEAWNRQCAGTALADRVILPGYQLVGVNGLSSEPRAMFEECRVKQLLKLTLSRGGLVAPAAPQRTVQDLGAEEEAVLAGKIWDKTLRAAAPIFVPTPSRRRAAVKAESLQGLGALHSV